MTRAGLLALWSHWRRNPLQLFTLVAGLALATGLWSGVQAVNAEARASYDAAAAVLDEGALDTLRPAGGGTIPLAQFLALRRAGWIVSPVIEGDLGGVRLLGIEPLTAPGGAGAARALADLDGFLRGGLVLADAETAARLGPLPGARVAVDAAIAPGTAVADIGTVQRLLGRGDAISRLILAPSQPPSRPPLADVAPGLSRHPAEGGGDMARLTDSFHLNLTAFGLLSFAVGIFIVHGAIGLAFEQRRGMVRTLRALGMPLGRLVGLMAGELVVLALVAGSIGVVLGWLMAAALLPDVAATLRGLYGVEVAGSLGLRPGWWAAGLGMALFGTAVAASGALWRIARMPLLASAQPRAWSAAARRGRLWLGGASLGLLLAALGLSRWGEGLLAGFALLACLLIGAALALPLILDTALALAGARARRVTAQWFWADARAQVPGLSLALMALLLAMAANVGVSTMVSSFRLTFTGFLDQRLASELYVSTEDGASLEAFAAPRTSEVLPVVSAEVVLAGLPGEVYGARIGATYRQNWAFLAANPDVWNEVAAGRAVIINEQLARRAGLWLGDPLAIGGQVLPVAGIFGDYGNPIGQAIIEGQLFARLFPGVAATRFGLRTDDPTALRRALVQDLGLPEGAILDQAAIKALSMQIFERTFKVTGALNVLTLAVAGFAILMSLLTLATMRLPHLAPVWALGLTRRRLGWLELARAVMLAALTAALALPLGLALAWVLLAVVNVEAFGWRLPMHLFPADYARLCALALAAAAVAAAWPAWRLARTPPARLLKVFANER